jgi:hypothetical protein
LPKEVHRSPIMQRLQRRDEQLLAGASARRPSRRTKNTPISVQGNVNHPMDEKSDRIWLVSLARDAIFSALGCMYLCAPRLPYLDVRDGLASRGGFRGIWGTCLVPELLLKVLPA